MSLDNAFSLRTLLSEAEENVALGKYRQIISRMKSSLLWKRFIYPVYASLAFPVLWQKGKIFRIANHQSIETFASNLLSLTRPSLQMLGETQTGVFPISEFLVNPL